jgi:hypothetical protein
MTMRLAKVLTTGVHGVLVSTHIWNISELEYPRTPRSCAPTRWNYQVPSDNGPVWAIASD